MKEGAAVLKIAVCDDEQTYLDKTRAMLEQYAAEHDVEITAEAFMNPSMLLDGIEAGERHDIYLLDIYMPGVSGMSVATELRSKGVRSPIIFLTSSTEHAVEAFGVDATHYLLKPYTQQNFFAAMDKAMQSISSHAEESIVLKIGGEYQNVSVDRILYCESADNYQRLWMKDARIRSEQRSSPATTRRPRATTPSCFTTPKASSIYRSEFRTRMRSKSRPQKKATTSPAATS